jgi:O-6-methylguanine DNA methyltransferase
MNKTFPQSDIPALWSRGITTSLGAFTLWASTVGLVRLEFARENAHTDPPDHVRQLLDNAEAQLSEYMHSRLRHFSLTFDWTHASEFNTRVWRAAAQIPFGQVRSYSELARQIGAPAAQRAVGHALGSNPLPIFIPCHRILRSDGGLGGFGLGLDMKRALLALEGYQGQIRQTQIKGDDEL